MADLIWQRSLIFVGFAVVALSGITYWWVDGPQLFRANQGWFWFATAAGNLFVGWAFSSLVRMIHGRDDWRAARRLLRVFAVGTALMGVAYLGLVKQLADVHALRRPNLFHSLAFFDSLALLGYLLASVGFWMAGSAIARSNRSPGQESPSTGVSEPESVTP